MKSINPLNTEAIYGLKPNGPYVSSYHGIMVQQRPAAVAFLINFVNTNNISHVIEIGTGYGGLTRALLDYTWSSIISIDIEDKATQLSFYSPRLIKLISDCQSAEATEIIAKLIADINTGQALFLIDGGYKMQEFNHYYKFLKPGDFIFVHDFAPNSVDFEYLKSNNIWLWHESNESELNLVNLERLEDFENNWKKYLWGTYKKQNIV